MANIQASFKLNPLIECNGPVNPKKKKIIQLPVLSISHSNKQKKSNNTDSKFKQNSVEENEKTIKKLRTVNKRINDVDIINEFKQLAGSTWSFQRSNSLLNIDSITNNAPSSPTIPTSASSDDSEFDFKKFPMPPPPRSNTTSLPSTPIPQIPLTLTPRELYRFPFTSQLSQSPRPSIPISEAFDPSQPPKLPLPPLPSNPPQTALSFGFPSIPLRSPSSKAESSSMLPVHQHQPILPTPSVKQDGILGGLAIDTSHTKMHWSIHQRDDYSGKSVDCSVISSPIKTHLPHLDNQTPNTHEPSHQYRKPDQQEADRAIVGLLSNPGSHQEEFKLDTIDGSLLAEELFIDSACEDDLKVTPLPTHQLEDDDDLLTSSYESINWSDVVMLPEEEDLIESVENFVTSQSIKESNIDILDQSFPKATSSYIPSHKATNSNAASQLKPTLSVELDMTSKAKRISLTSTSNKHLSTFSVGDLSEWIKQHHGSLELQSGPLQSDDDESEIDLEESLDRLAKRLGYQGEYIEDQLSRPISFQDPPSPSSPSNLPGTELDDDYDRDDLFTTMENPIIPAQKNKDILSLAFSPTFNAVPSGTRSDGRTRSSSSTCSFTTNSTASILTPITPIDHKPFHQLPHHSPQSKLRHQSSLSKLDLGSTNRPMLEHKRSSLSMAVQSNNHSKFKPAYRPQPMKVIEEPSSSDEEEFDLSLDHPRRPAYMPNSLPFTSRLSSTKAPRSTVLPSSTPSLFATLPRPSSTLRRPLEPSSLQLNPTPSSNLVQPQSCHGTSRKRSGTIHESPTAVNGEESNTPLAFNFAKTAIPRGTLAKTMLKAPRVQLSTPNLRSSIPKPSFTKTVNSQPTSSNANSENISIASPNLSSSRIKPKMSHDQLSSVITDTERRLPSLPSSVGRPIPGRIPVHSSHSHLLASVPRQQLRVLSQPSHPQIDEKPASNLSPPLTPNMADPESNPSPLDVMPPPGTPGLLERRQRLSGGPSRAAGESCKHESHDVEGERPASAPIAESFGRVSRPETPRRASSGTIDSSHVGSHPRASSVNQQMSSSMTAEDNRRSSSKWSRNMNLQSESISEAPEEEGQTENLTSTSMTSEPSSAERKLRLKPLFLGSSALPGDRIVSCEPTLRQVKSRASLSPSANRLTFPNNPPLMTSYLTRRSSIGFSPSRPTSFPVTVGYTSSLSMNEQEIASSGHGSGERSPNLSLSHTRASGSISIRQLTYN
ncbi:uncharacterized protein MELLADRAFT_116936 [Melampsora larici-populina 98AG31]|uniref:Uncharacterized protein n=1 Tax=Melampsora larici-populina (strain 98AG31 / pathotype 3-4-7) TaxID=747676 RepID=F4RRK8_MELLP|nr:uncharacterized protein MELLADRAFT_116936 [Melampsora larici-populina 98AG31]EGG05007.1 hypothetical protein MELLADRAFT_116936 [Melampsora larici-populina 98AG31]